MSLSSKKVAEILENEDKDFLSFLKKYYKTNDVNYIFLLLLQNIFVKNKSLEFYINNVKNVYGYEEMLIFIDKTLDKKSTNFNVFAEKIMFIYDVTLDEEKINRLKDSDSERIKNYIRLKYVKKEFAKKPNWVTKKEDENITLLEKTPVGLSEDNLNTKFKNILENINEFSYTTNDDNDEDEYNKLMKGEELISKQDSIFIYLSHMADENDLKKIKNKEYYDEYQREFRVWGPINRSASDCCSAPGGIGPCRMLYCCCNEGGDDREYNEFAEWFSGECDNCSRKIINKSCAIRFPLVTGGWRGCYCSVSCMKELNSNLDQKDFDLIKRTVENIKSYGIMDRS
jgi:hypothetical protein